jgi:hypothetical protein
MAAGTARTANWPRNFRPQPGFFGALLLSMGAAIGTGGVPLTGTATTTVFVPVPAARKFAVTGASMQGPTAAVGGSTITAQLIRDNAGTPVTLTAATSITNAVITGLCTDWPVTASDANRTCNAGDTLRWEVVAATTVTTAPQLTGQVEISVIQ